jgi:hypothetical protein
MLRSEAVIPAPISVSPSRIVDIIRGAVSGMDQVSRDHPIAVDIVGMRPHFGLVDYRVRCWGRFTIVQDDPLSPMVRLRVWYAFQRHEIVTPRWGLDRDLDELPPLMVPAHPDTQTPIVPILSALEATRRWHTSRLAELECLARAGRRQLFAPNEPILLPRDLDQAVAVVVAGDVRASVPTEPDWIEQAVKEIHRQGAAVDWDQEMLARVESQLGRAIGPYARLAVRLAARESDELGTLYGRLAALIHDRAARDEFLRVAPQIPFRDFGPGTAFVVRCGRAGLSAPDGPLTARGEVELLAIRPHVLRDMQQATACEVT